MKKIISVLAVIVLIGGGCTLPKPASDIVTGQDFLEEIAAQEKITDIKHFYDVWNSSEQIMAIVWGSEDYGKPFGVSCVYQNMQGLTLGSESFLLVGDLGHIYIDDVSWENGNIHFNQYATDQNGTEVQDSHVLTVN